MCRCWEWSIVLRWQKTTRPDGALMQSHMQPCSRIFQRSNEACMENFVGLMPKYRYNVLREGTLSKLSVRRGRLFVQRAGFSCHGTVISLQAHQAPHHMWRCCGAWSSRCHFSTSNMFLRKWVWGKGPPEEVCVSRGVVPGGGKRYFRFCTKIPCLVRR